MPAAVPDRKSRRVTGRVPMMRETTFDIATSAQIAFVIGLAIFVFLLIAIWLSNLLPDNTVIPAYMETGDGGFEDGDPNESLDVESPEDPTDDPSVSNDQDVTQLEQITEQILTMSDNAAALSQPNDFTDPSGGGNPGSAEGSGGRPFGSGGPGKGGVRREQRWIVEFADSGNLKSYARQLDQFQIELACAFKDGRIYYVSGMSSSPNVREARLTSKDQRLLMSWQGGEREKADLELLAAAGVPSPETGRVLHCYPPDVEQMLARLELDYANKPVEQIRRTYFQVKRGSNGYEFVVVNQKLR